MTVQVSDDSFEAEVLDSSIPVLVDFWAGWCGPCKLLAPVIDEIAADYEGKLKVCKFDVEKGGKVPSQYGVMSIPAVFIFKEGEVQEQIIGYVPREHIVEKIERVV